MKNESSAVELRPNAPPTILLRSPSSPAVAEDNFCRQETNLGVERDEHMLQLTEPEEHLHHHHHGHLHHHHHHHHNHHLHDRGACVRWPCGLSNFSVSLIVGMIGFSIFWLVLLLRIYLPDEYFFGSTSSVKNATNVGVVSNVMNVTNVTNVSVLSNVTNVITECNVTLARNTTTT